ncbi:MAG: hypothetical protein J7M18_06160, partial [Candidatus Eremiobacteraeota bacterium]|nr:hypothetical protein [Candidatus Eremiobacteraeota bacterium]
SIYITMAKAYHGLGDENNAVNAVKTALKLDPDLKDEIENDPVLSPLFKGKITRFDWKAGDNIKKEEE